MPIKEKRIRKKPRTNPMLKVRIRKVTVNMSVGESGEKLEKAATVLEQLTGQKPAKRKAKKTIRDFGIRKGEPISCIVSLRKERAMEFLSKALEAVDNRLSKKCFDSNGNFSFGIKEHIEIPEAKYIPELGIFGMDVTVALGRAGYRVKQRRRSRSKIGIKHMLTIEEATLFTRDTLGVEIV